MPDSLAAFPLSNKFIRRNIDKGKRYDFLRMLARRDMMEPFGSDFAVKALDTTNQWTIAATSTSTTWAIRAEAGGWLRGVTGASVATGALQIQGPAKYWTGTSYCLFACLMKVDAITEVRIEQGFADVLPAVGTSMVSDITASVAFASTVQAAAYVYDHTGSTTTSGLYTVGTSVAAARVVTTTARPVAATPWLVVVEVNGTNVRVWAGDSDVPPLVATSGSLTAATGMLPFFMVKTSSGSKTVDLDMFWAYSGRLG